MHAHITIRHHTRVVVWIIVRMIRRHERMAVVRRVRIVVKMMRDVRRSLMSIEMRHINVNWRAETPLVILITLIRCHAPILIKVRMMRLIKFRPILLSLESEMMMIMPLQ
jgi:hypothetical protein